MVLPAGGNWWNYLSQGKLQKPIDFDEKQALRRQWFAGVGGDQRSIGRYIFNLTNK
jgi:hypothetical protein